MPLIVLNRERDDDDDKPRPLDPTPVPRPQPEPPPDDDDRPKPKPQPQPEPPPPDDDEPPKTAPVDPKDVAPEPKPEVGAPEPKKPEAAKPGQPGSPGFTWAKYKPSGYGTGDDPTFEQFVAYGQFKGTPIQDLPWGSIEGLEDAYQLYLDTIAGFEAKGQWGLAEMTRRIHGFTSVAKGGGLDTYPWLPGFDFDKWKQIAPGGVSPGATAGTPAADVLATTAQGLLADRGARATGVDSPGLTLVDTPEESRLRKYGRGPGSQGGGV